MIRSFLNKHVAIRLREGLTIEGMLIHVDGSLAHNGGIGNLILSDKTIIRGSHVQHVALKR